MDPLFLHFWQIYQNEMSHFFENSSIYLYKCTTRFCLEYCCQDRVHGPSFYLDILDKLKKWISRTVDPSCTASLEPLSHCRNVANLSLFLRYYFGRCLSELAQMVPLPHSRGGTIRYAILVNNFSDFIPTCYKDFLQVLSSHS